MFELVKQKEGFETKLQALESPDSDKRAKSYTKTKIGSEIAIENNRGKILSLPEETIICPGHGPMTTVGEEQEHNAFF